MFIPLAPLPSLPSRPHRHPNKFLRELNAPYNPTVPISLAFKQVSQQRGWKHGSKRWRKRWNSCMNSEYDRLIGSRIASLETWQELCAKVGIKETFPSINKCKKVRGLNIPRFSAWITLTHSRRHWPASMSTLLTFWTLGTQVSLRFASITREILPPTRHCTRSTLVGALLSRTKSSESSCAISSKRPLRCSSSFLVQDDWFS